MLTQLRIHALGVIGDAELDLGPGLVAITGETGAGKTMVVQGLGLLLGGRADAGVVRRGVRKAVVEGRFTGVEAGSRAAELVAEWGGDVDGDELLVARHVSASGRSRAYVGGVQVSAAQLAEVAGDLATIHGQSEQIRLGTPERQREVLDRWCGEEHLATLGKYGEAFARRRELAAEREELVREAQSRARQVDLLRFGLDEIAAVDPQPGEDEALLAESNRLQAADQLRELAAEAVAALSGTVPGDAGGGGEDARSASDLVVQAGRALASAARIDAGATRLVQQLREVAVALNDAAADAASYLADLDADPLRLEAVMERRSRLAGLTRKYGSTIDEVRAWAAESASRLDGLVGSDDRVEHLAREIEQLDDDLARLAVSISERRRAGAEELADRVAVELADLALPHARLRFDLQPLGEFGSTGAERVALLFSANPGSEPRPLGKVASGGELSRVRLALEVVLADPDVGHAFVFDEVDAGVGGAVALQIGRRLATLGRAGQVIVVTHLAQVAAFAQRQLVVSKDSSGEVTDSTIVEVGGESRLAELARMMGGLDKSDTALAHARDLMAEAAGG